MQGEHELCTLVYGMLLVFGQVQGHFFILLNRAVHLPQQDHC